MMNGINYSTAAGKPAVFLLPFSMRKWYTSQEPRKAGLVEISLIFRAIRDRNYGMDCFLFEGDC